MDRRGAEIRVPELALDDVQRDALAGELKRLGVTELVWCKPAPHTGLGGEAAKLDAYRGA